jgi:hypothetical protein
MEWAGLLKALPSAAAAPDATRLGTLMYESHASYSACRLGSDGTDRLVSLARAAGSAHGIYGAKITGGGSGGTVAILGDASAGRYGPRHRARVRPAKPAVTRTSSKAHLRALLESGRFVSMRLERFPRSLGMTTRKDLAIFLLLVVLCAIVTALNPRFLSPANLQNTARLIGAFGIFSLGLGLVIITGGIDLSVGSSFALLGVLLSIMLTEWHLPWALAVIAIVGLAALLGAVHGLLITRLRLQPFVVTLCGLLVYRGTCEVHCRRRDEGLWRGRRIPHVAAAHDR